MRIESRPWKLDLKALWWNRNRGEVYAAIMGQLGKKIMRHIATRKFKLRY